MGVGLYTLKKKAIILIKHESTREYAYFLQLAIANALSQDAQEMVDRVIKGAHKGWQNSQIFPTLVVQVGMDGIPKSGAPMFAWRNKRVYCFEDDLLNPVGYLGDRELGGFAFRSIEEQRLVDDNATARAIDAGRTKVYKDFWSGRTFQTGEEFLEYRRGKFKADVREAAGPVRDKSPSHPHRLTKILNLIRHIEVKGRRASIADIQYLDCLKQKAAQLGYPSLAGTNNPVRQKSAPAVL
jgi:hypothetical protein